MGISMSAACYDLGMFALISAVVILNTGRGETLLFPVLSGLVILRKSGGTRT
jgi:hypothetical protein